MSSRTIEKVVPATKKHILRLVGTVDCDGNGTEHPLEEVDPFILLDSGTIAQDMMPPFGPHPHHGHSVVTILLQGKMKSWDSFQEQDPTTITRTKDVSTTQPVREFRDIITAPASYWVDAGRGLFHDERASIEDESDPSQHVKLLQLWVGVKQEDRTTPPRVQVDENTPTFNCFGRRRDRINDTDESDVIVVGLGRYFVGPRTAIETPHPVTVAHIQQEPGTEFKYPIDSTKHGGFVVNLKGKAAFGGDDDTAPIQPKNEWDVLVLKNSDDEEEDDDGTGGCASFLRIETPSNEGAEYVVATGERIGQSWAKKLVANGAVIAATPEEARTLAESVQAMAESGLNKDGGSFFPFGVR